MSFNESLRVPWGYLSSFKTLGEVETILLVHYHPEYVRRLLAWLTSKGGEVGIGGTWRPQNGQLGPDGKPLPGHAPEGKSFHQDQPYNDGFVGACAVDLVLKALPGGVHRTIPWSQVPAQGSAEARLWGVHSNVATEAWHMQPVEIDGWQSWWDAGRPAPVANYPIPGDTPTPPPTPTPGGTVLLYRVRPGDSYWRICETVYEDGKATTARVAELQAVNGGQALHPDDIINVPGRVAA